MVHCFKPGKHVKKLYSYHKVSTNPWFLYSYHKVSTNPWFQTMILHKVIVSNHISYFKTITLSSNICFKPWKRSISHAPNHEHCLPNHDHAQILHGDLEQIANWVEAPSSWSKRPWSNGWNPLMISKRWYLKSPSREIFSCYNVGKILPIRRLHNMSSYSP
jgi:hypothetical protein